MHELEFVKRRHRKAEPVPNALQYIYPNKIKNFNVFQRRGIGAIGSASDSRLGLAYCGTPGGYRFKSGVSHFFGFFLLFSAKLRRNWNCVVESPGFTFCIDN